MHNTSKMSSYHIYKVAQMLVVVFFQTMTPVINNDALFSPSMQYFYIHYSYITYFMKYSGKPSSWWRSRVMRIPGGLSLWLKGHMAERQ